MMGPVKPGLANQKKASNLTLAHVLHVFQDGIMRLMFKFIAVALVAAISAAAVTIMFHLGAVPDVVQKQDVSYSDFIAIMLTALGLMITVLGFFVAVAGVIGWSTLENKLHDHSINYFKDQLGQDGKLREEMEKLIEQLTYRGVETFKAPQGEQATKPPLGPEGEYND